MAIAVMCPRCQTAIEVTDDLADQPICCQRCLHTFERSKGTSSAIQAGPTRVTAPQDEDDRAPPPSRPHAEPRAPFPVVPLLLVLIGLLFFVLVASVGFNVWLVVNPDQRDGMDRRARQAEIQAQQARVQAEQAAELARVNAQQEQERGAELQKKLAEMRRERDDALEALEETRRQLDRLKAK